MVDFGKLSVGMTDTRGKPNLIPAEFHFFRAFKITRSSMCFYIGSNHDLAAGDRRLGHRDYILWKKSYKSLLPQPTVW